MSGKKFRVLLAESGTGEAADSLRLLYPGPDSTLELSVVSTVSTLLATIELAAPETIFLDLSLGKPDPLDAVRRVHRAAPGIPLIVFADIADKSYAARSISEGAIDYLLKGFMDTHTLERVLRTALERNTVEGLADLLRDKLTGLYNRDGFTTLGARTMEMATRSGGTLILLCALIENYASLHEELGSLGCELAVRETAELVGSCFRRSDFLGRLGDAQFAALAVDAAEPSASVLRQRVESRLAIHNQSRQPWGPLMLRLSVGYWGANDPRSFAAFLDVVESELRQAEVALSQAGTRQDSRMER
ncbi:MAG TPA: diguanylate cyclase [Verrucomicrobiae bacterium]|jgi:diguanylate cyclase (GGDEF)-like protein|nr:diguanylate cyclase [Verrucomicrobiae bacterium]